MNTFKVGEVAICHGFVNWPELNGTECEILGGLKERAGFERTGNFYIGPQYLARFADGDVAAVSPHKLRKRRPPGADEAERLTAELFNRLTGKVQA